MGSASIYAVLSMELKDEDIIQRYLLGDKKSFEVLVKRHFEGVYRFCYRLLLRQSDAEDVTQETFLKVWKNLPKFKQGAVFKSWLYRIARNGAIDFLRRNKTSAFSELSDEGDSLVEVIASEEPLPDEIFFNKENKEFLEKAIEFLPTDYKIVLSLRYDSELTFDEIGEVLGKSLNTVKSQHRRALEVLQKTFFAPER